jgi:ferrochelatase
MTESPDAVLLTAHGTVEHLHELPEFLLRIRHGRPAPPGLVAELERRYSAIGGSPLLRVTNEQASLLAAKLGAPVFVGMRLWKPELSEAVAQALRAGVKRLCVLPLAPFSVHVYAKAVEKACTDLGVQLELVLATPFGASDEFVAAQADLIRPHLSSSLAPTQAEALVLTAHSLPMSVVNAGDPYREQVEASARAIAERLRRPFVLAYQSQGADGGDWLGPDLRRVLAELREQGKERVVIAPIGFLSDHVETLYDLDIEARAWAGELGLSFSRVPALNTAPALISALEAAARRAFRLSPGGEVCTIPG